MRNRLILVLIGIAITTPAAAQLGLPPLGGSVGEVLRPLDRTLDPLEETVTGITARAARLAEARIDRLTSLLRRHPDAIERDAAGELARKGELLLLDPSEAEVAAAERAGFAVLERARLGALGMAVVRLAVPKRLSLARAEKKLHELLPEATVTADNLHLPAGAAMPVAGAAAVSNEAAGVRVGVIDGAPGPTIPVEAVRGFARGAPRPSHHGSAVVSLLRAAGARRVAVADVYGTDPAGGNALAISRGIDWLARQNARVVAISLDGPDNPVLGRAIALARRRGMVFVAAVGNDGPAAPPAYPASYPGVLAVTAVDGRNRSLIEAGRALHLDYAAPGADIFGANAAGKRVKLRGTSYAVPLVAARAAAVIGAGGAIAALDREAVDLGKRGPDPVYGRGLLCGDCRGAR